MNTWVEVQMVDSTHTHRTILTGLIECDVRLHVSKLVETLLDGHDLLEHPGLTIVEISVTEKPKMITAVPSFIVEHGRPAIRGEDYDDTLTEDEHHYLSGKGRYYNLEDINDKELQDLLSLEGKEYHNVYTQRYTKKARP